MTKYIAFTATKDGRLLSIERVNEDPGWIDYVSEFRERWERRIGGKVAIESTSREEFEHWFAECYARYKARLVPR